MRSHRQRFGAAGSMMIRSPPPPRLKVVDLNPHLSCILCGGYFIDATTITECLHSFCRACIVPYLETSEYCPVCEVQVHKSRPLRSDRILQDIVYKLVPGLFQNEMKRRREFYGTQPPEALKKSRDAEDRGECLDDKFIYAPDEIFSLSVEYGRETEKQDSLNDEDCVPKRRFLRCPAAITVAHIKKFIRMKYGIPNSYEVDLKYDKETLLDEYSLMDVAYIFMWQRKGPMRFFYRIIEKPPKKTKIQPNYISDPSPAEESTMETETVAKEESGVEESSAVQPVIPQSQPTCAKETIEPPVESHEVSSSRETPANDETSCILESIPETSVRTTLDNEKCDLKEPSDKLPPSETCQKNLLKIIPFKFPPITLKSPPSESKPAVMTVAPLTKPSSSLPTTSTTAVSGTVTHGLYTGITIKKSPEKTLPPFKISTHLLPPRVPPLKLSPPRFSKLENCIRELSSSKKSSSKKSKSSKNSIDKLEMKVAQLKSGSVKCVAPLVISVPPESKQEIQKDVRNLTPEKKFEELPIEKIPTEKPFIKETVADDKMFSDDEKMDLDSELFEGRLVIAEPDIPSKEDSNNSDSKCSDSLPKSSMKPEDSEDEEIDVVDDGEVDSGRGSDISRTEARSLCGDDDLGSPESVPKTPEAERPPSTAIPNLTFTEIKQSPKSNGVASSSAKRAPPLTNGSDCGVLDLSTCSRKRSHNGDMPVHRNKQVANPAVLDKTRQTTTPCISPNHSSFKILPEIPHVSLYKSKHESSRGNFKCRGNTLTVINPDPNGNRPKIVIRNLGPRPDRGHERFHHHHHHNHHHHQRM